MCKAQHVVYEQCSVSVSLRQGLTAGFAVGGGDVSAAAGGGGAAVFSASAGFPIQLFTRPATLPLTPTTSWEGGTHFQCSALRKASSPSACDLAHLVCRSWTLRGAAQVACLPHALDVACPSCRNVWQRRFGGFYVFVSLWNKNMDLDYFTGDSQFVRLVLSLLPFGWSRSSQKEPGIDGSITRPT